MADSKVKAGSKTNTPAAISIKGVSKTFRLPHEKQNSLKTLILNFYKRRTYEQQKVLSNISFDIPEGQFFGIVGRNGSGKSTLLKMLAGIYAPTKGTITVNGQLTPFIELGVGFNPELTGRENVYLNGALLGFSRKNMDSMYSDIVAFAELEKFMDQKLKNYSSGMQVRLAFSIAIRADSDILLLDEVLAVGDAIFQKKCYNYFKELKRRKKTVVFVSHDSNALQEYCDSGVLIESGKVVARGKISHVVREYIDLLNKEEERLSDAEDERAAMQPAKKKNRWGTGDITVDELHIGDEPTGVRRTVFTDDQLHLALAVTFTAQKDSEAPVYGITISDAAGQRIFASNTLWSRVDTADLVKGQSVTVVWEIPNIFNSGDFMVTPAVANKSGTEIYDWREEMGRIKVRKTLQSSGCANAPHIIKIGSL